jgi:hypothetical protein
MSTTSSGKKAFSRRSFVSVAGGAAGVLAALKSVASPRAAIAAEPAPTPEAPVAAAAVAPAAAPVPDPAAVAAAFKKPTRVVDAASLPRADAEVLRAVGALRPGTNVHGYKVVAVYGVYMGAIPVILQDKKGDRFQVDVCAKDTQPGAPNAVISTRSLSFFLANGGDGIRPSDESKGLGAIALASYLKNRRTAGFRPSGLLTLRERNATHPYGAFSVSV